MRCKQKSLEQYAIDFVQAGPTVLQNCTSTFLCNLNKAAAPQLSQHRGCHFSRIARPRDRSGRRFVRCEPLPARTCRRGGWRGPGWGHVQIINLSAVCVRVCLSQVLVSLSPGPKGTHTHRLLLLYTHRPGRHTVIAGKRKKRKIGTERHSKKDERHTESTKWSCPIGRFTVMHS